MEKAQKLKNARNLLLKLHKALVDRERELYERNHGPLTSGQFLNVLLEDEDLAWLRKFSMLIVEIDEMFSQKDGIPADMIEANLEKMNELVEMKDPDEFFKAKYQFAIQNDVDVAGLQSELKTALSKPPA